ncbi:MAG TPA: hypothetical protein DCW31_04640 [Lactobacillus sp.]|nr:hypothetical protein [Lactobacillus sp.]
MSEHNDRIVSNDIVMEEFQRAYLFQRKFLRTYANAPKKKYGITFDEYLIIHDIKTTATNLSSIDLANRHQVSKPAMTRLLNGLQEKGLIEFVVSKHDQRRKNWALTPKGQEIETNITSHELENVDKWIGQVGLSRIQGFFSFLDEFQSAITDTHGFFPVEGGTISNENKVNRLN